MTEIPFPDILICHSPLLSRTTLLYLYKLVCGEQLKNQQQEKQWTASSPLNTYSISWCMDWPDWSWIISLWLPALSPCLVPSSPSKWISLPTDSLVNMRLDSFDLYVLLFCPIGLLVNRPVFPLPWWLMWHTAKRYTGVNYCSSWSSLWISDANKDSRGWVIQDIHFPSDLMIAAAFYNCRSVCDTPCQSFIDLTTKS